MINGKIEQVYNVSNGLRARCCDIVRPLNHGVCDEIFDNIQEEINICHEIMFKFTHENNLLGFIKGCIAPTMEVVSPDWSVDLKKARIDYLYVDRDSQQQHIGARLLTAYTNYVRNIGARCLYLDSSQFAVNFYKKNGFETIWFGRRMGKML